MTRLTSYADNIRTALVDRLQPVEGGPLDGVRIITEADIERALGDAAIPPIDYHIGELATPATVYLSAKCHICGEYAAVTVGLESKTLVDDKRRVLSAKVDAGSVDHICGQMPLPIDVTPEGQTGAWDLPPTSAFGAAVEAVVAMLARVGLTLDPERVDGWTEPEREAAEQWAVAAHVAAESNETPPDPPEHVKAALTAKEPEPCPKPGCLRAAEHSGHHKYAKAPEPEPEPEPDDDHLPE